MKILLVVLLGILGVCVGNKLLIQGWEAQEGIPLHRNLLRELMMKIAPLFAADDQGQIKAVVNDYADKLFKNIESFCAVNGLDPIPLENITDVRDASSLTLWDGKLYGISTIDRNGDLELTYVHDDKTLYIQIPIQFTKLKFSYGYHVEILHLGPEGEMEGGISEFKANLVLSFDFRSFHANIESIDTSKMGKIELKFEDNGLLDLIVNLLSDVTTTILHPLIENIISGIISSVADLIVDDVNTGIDNFLRPNSTDNSTTTNNTDLFDRSFRPINIVRV